MNIDTPMDKPLVEFRRRIIKQWLPAYCSDSNRNHSREGVKAAYSLLAVDARDFPGAVDCGLFVDDGGGRCTAPRSRASEIMSPKA